MSKYTTELRFLCEQKAGYDESQGYSKIEEVIDKSWDKIFDVNRFEIFDEEYREPLCKKIIRHFYTREIGEETAGLWLFRLNNKMSEIMPYYNKLYTAWLQEFNIFDNVDYETDHTLNKSGVKDGTENETGNDTINKTNNQTGHTHSVTDGTIVQDNDGGYTKNVDGDNEHIDRYSDTPQGALTGVMNDTYLTNARRVTDDIDEDTTETHNDLTTTDNDTDVTVDTSLGEIGSETHNKTSGKILHSTEATADNYHERVHGKMSTRSYASLLEEYKNSLINIDMLIINELNNLFMMIW